MGISQRPLAAAWTEWHSGERAVQARLGLGQPIAVFVDGLPTSHQIFYATRLAYLPVVTLDEEGRPWASMLTGPDGKPGFIESTDTDSMFIHAHVSDGDPIRRNVALGSGHLFAGVGVEASTGRRNKFGGRITRTHEEDNTLHLDIETKWSLGLCPKYIAEREVIAHRDIHPIVLHNRLHLDHDDCLPEAALSLVRKSDTAYIATSFVPTPEDAGTHAPRLGVNHRGGRPGFIRVRNDGRTLVLPNYAGNRALNSLGNIHVTPRAGFVFPDFDSGAVLYVTGDAETLYDADAQAIMPGRDIITTVRVTGFVLVADALPLRHASVHASAHSPPVLFLAEESPADQAAEPTVHLVAARVLSPTLTHYTFRASRPLADFRPAGVVVLDLRRTFADRAGHDDCVRTWTVSHPPTPTRPDEFGLTLRTKADGLLTPLLASAVRTRDPHVSVADLDIRGALRGSRGDVPLPVPGRYLWVAGGIGATPFLAASKYIAGRPGPWDIVLLLSTGEPTVIPPLFVEALAGAEDVRLQLHIFTNEQVGLSELDLPTFFDVHVHAGRIPTDGTLFKEVDMTNRHAHICGSLPFVNNAMVGLEKAGVDPQSVFRERFTY